MNILLINHYAGSPDMGMEYRPYYFSQEWIQLGHKVMIAAASYSHLRVRQPNILKSYEDESVDGIIYRWFRTSKYTGNGISRLINIFQFLFRLLMYSKIISENFKPEIVIASSTYPLDIFPAFLIARHSKAKLIFEVHDLWPLSLIELGGMNKWHPLILFLQVAENFAYRKSDRVVSMLPGIHEHMKARGGMLDKLVIIPNGIVDGESFSKLHLCENSINAIEKIESIKADGFNIVGYIGGMAIANELNTFLEAAKNLINEKIIFVMIGDGLYKSTLIDKIRVDNLTNVIYFDSISKRAVNTVLKYFNLSYLGWKDNPIYRFGISPNKLMDYMSAGTPIIISINKMVPNNLVEESSCGVTVEPQNATALAKAIKDFFLLCERDRVLMGISGQNYVNKHLRVETLAKEYIEATL